MVVAYIGCERCDMIYYMSKLAIGTGKSVLIVDNSKRGDLYRALTNGTGNRKDTNYGSVLRLCDVTDEEANSFDFVFLYHGEADIDMPYELAVDQLYVACEVTKMSIEDTKDALTYSGITAPHTAFVAREVVSEKFKTETMVAMLGLTTEDHYVVGLTEEDAQKYNALINSGEQRIKGCSKDMQFFLEQYVKTVLQASDKDAKRIVGRM